MKTEFWRGKRVFLTGHTGFKGSWLSLWLQRMGADVCGYALAPQTTPDLFTEAQVAEGMQSVIGDIRDRSLLAKTIGEFQPEIVLHLAAQALVRESYDAPLETFEVNVMGTANLLDAIRTCPTVKAVVVVTSDKCYENQGWVWGYRESDPMGGSDPYSASKGCAELVTSSYRRSFFKEGPLLASARAGNVVGGGDWADDRLVPDTIRAFAKSEAVTLRNPDATRPWQHVLEPLAGYLALAETLFAGISSAANGWNFGPAGVATVEQVVSRVCQSWGSEAEWKVERDAVSVAKPEAHVLHLDSTKAARLLDWSPLLDLDATVQWTSSWYQAHVEKSSARELCEQDIANYEALIAS